LLPQIYAVKTMLKSRITRDKQIQRIGTERRVLMEASDHPFIARMHYAFQNHRQLFFVLDFCAGGDLYYHLTRMKNSRFKHFR
jgi:serine/threonine protein kinase